MLLSAILCTASLAAAPAGVHVEARLEPTTIPFHKTARYTVTLEAPVGTAFNMPRMFGRFDGLVPMDIPEREETVTDEGNVRISDTYTSVDRFLKKWIFESS